LLPSPRLGAIRLLDLVFYVSVCVLGVQVMCFFILWLSFTANVRENAWEFGVLRSIGVNVSESFLLS
jgi:hypothetical protein